MKTFIFIAATAMPCLSFASDLSAKLNCHLTFEQTKYVDNNPVIQTQTIPLQKGHYNSNPPASFISGRFQHFDLHIQDAESIVAISLTQKNGGESKNLFYIRLKPTDSLDIRIPISQEGPTWNPISKDLHLVCESIR